MDLIQRALFTLADTMDLWRDAAIAGLALLVIGCILLVVEIHR